MEHQAIRCISLRIGLLEGEDCQVSVRFSGQMPCDDFSGKQIHDNAQIIPFSACLDIGDVACPDQIRGFLVKILMRMVVAWAAVGVCCLVPGLVRGHFRELQCFHQSVHSADADVNAMVTL